MKKKKLRLDELKVKSFVILKNDLENKTIKAGRNTSIDTPSDIDPISDPFETKVDCDPTPATWCYWCPMD